MSYSGKKTLVYTIFKEVFGETKVVRRDKFSFQENKHYYIFDFLNCVNKYEIVKLIKEIVSKYDHYTDMNKIYNTLQNIFNKSNTEYYYYLSSDIDLKEIGNKIFGKKLLYCDIKPTHIDRNPDENSMKKIIIDNYILSQKSEIIYISEYSNFGKVAVLSGNHKDIYNTKLEKINKKYIYKRIFRGL